MNERERIARYPYKMKDLCEKTGLPRQVVHFYIQQGLVPEGYKTGRNTAFYGEEHVARIKLVRQLQHERFLPLKAIRAMLEARDEVFSPVQRRVLEDVKARMSDALLPPRDPSNTVSVRAVCEAAGVSFDEVRALSEGGLFGIVEHQREALINREDAWMVELWGELRAAGFTEELGFQPRDITLFERAISKLFDDEVKLLASRMSHLPPEDLATMLEKALPLINSFLARYHLTRARNFLSTL